MQAERWRRIEDLYPAALAEAPEKRAAFLAQGCPDDAQRRSEVLSLLEFEVDEPAGKRGRSALACAGKRASAAGRSACATAGFRRCRT